MTCWMCNTLFVCTGMWIVKCVCVWLFVTSVECVCLTQLILGASYCKEVPFISQFGSHSGHYILRYLLILDAMEQSFVRETAFRNVNEAIRSDNWH